MHRTENIRFLNYQGVQLFTEPKQFFSQLKQQKPQNTSYVDGIRVTFNSYFTNVLPKLGSRDGME